MAPPAAAGTSASAAPEPPHGEEAAKRRCRPAHSAGTWARVITMGVQGAVMTTALALFLLFTFAACLLMMALVFAARAFRRQGIRYRPFPEHSEPPPRPIGLAAAQISHLSCFESSPWDGPPPPPLPTCAICLDPSPSSIRLHVALLPAECSILHIHPSSLLEVMRTGGHPRR